MPDHSAVSVPTRWPAARLRVLAAIFLASAGAAACPHPAVPSTPSPITQLPDTGSGTLAIVDVTVIVRPNEPALLHQTVVVTDGMITAVGPAASTAVPGSAVRIPGSGRFLMAGLTDMHVHVFDRDEFLLYLANGITTIRNLSGYAMHLAWRDSLAAGTIAGPRLVTSGPILDGDPPMRSTNTVLRDAAAAEAEVHREADAGYDLIKVYDDISPVAYRAVTAAAHRLGMRVAGHVPTPVGLATVLAPGGQDEIEHLEELLPYFDDGRSVTGLDSIAHAIAAAGVTVTPTLTVYASALAQATDWPSVQARPEMRYVNPATRAQWGWDQTAAARSGQPREVARYLRTTAFFQEQLLPALRRAGVTVLVGSDAPIATLVPGFALHDELLLLSAAGVSDQDVLTMATVNAAAATGAASHRGAVRVGHDADLLLLGADPRHGLAALKDRVGVIAAGRWYAQRELNRRLDALAAVYRVVGLYDTKVTRVEGNCPLGTEDAETEVTVGASPSVVLLRHGGTTYGGRLEDDGSFRMGERTVQVDGTDYHLAVEGRFRAEVLDARVTVTWGTAPACRVIVRWLGARRMG